MKEFKSITEIMETLENMRYNYYGFRNATEHDLKVIESGRDYLDVSHDWIDGNDSGKELPGSCGIYISDDMTEEELTSRYTQCLYGYFGKTILLIADNNSEWGEDDNEIILGSNGCGADVIGYVTI